MLWSGKKLFPSSFAFAHSSSSTIHFHYFEFIPKSETSDPSHPMDQILMHSVDSTYLQQRSVIYCNETIDFRIVEHLLKFSMISEICWGRILGWNNIIVMDNSYSLKLKTKTAGLFIHFKLYIYSINCKRLVCFQFLLHFSMNAAWCSLC